MCNPIQDCEVSSVVTINQSSKAGTSHIVKYDLEQVASVHQLGCSLLGRWGIPDRPVERAVWLPSIRAARVVLAVCP